MTNPTTQMPAYEALLLLPRLQVQNANAVSSPLTWGFPSPTAFTGFTHALQRRLSAEMDGLSFQGVAIVCHQFEPQAHDLSPYRAGQFALTRNPVDNRRKIDKDGQTTPMSIVEEGRAHLQLSLLIAVEKMPVAFVTEEVVELVAELLPSMRVAGGSVIGVGGKPCLFSAGETEAEQAKTLRKVKRRLLPGFALVGRADLLAQRLQEMRGHQADATTLDAVLDISALTIESQMPCDAEAGDSERVEWAVRRPGGWLVPLPLGYLGISPLYEPGAVKHARDEQTPFQFVESLYGIGQWIGPHRIRDLNGLFWYPQNDTENNTYLCHNDFKTA